VQVASRYALHKLGDTRLSQDLVLFARSDDAHVRGFTVMTLGMLGEPSGIKILQRMQADKNPTVRLQVAEALWRLGSEQGLENLVASAVSVYPDDQAVAFLALAEPRDRRITEHVRGGLTADYEEPRLVAARAMGMLGSDEGYVIAQKGVESNDAKKQLKYQRQVLGLLAFGAIGRSDAIEFIIPKLNSEDPDVRVAAATAVLQLTPKK
jgi:HEAT repeat protein